MSGTPPGGSAEEAARRSQRYWLLSRVFLEQPTEALLADLAVALPPPGEGDEDSELADTLRSALQHAMSGPEALVRLQVEHTRLLSGAVRTALPPPFESVLLDEQAFTARTEAVAEACRDAGFPDVAPEAGPPDHLGAELRFMALLAHAEMGALQAGDAARATALRDRQRRFLADHLLAWAPDYAERFTAEARITFYRAIGDLTGDTLAVDRQLLLDGAP